MKSGSSILGRWILMGFRQNGPNLMPSSQYHVTTPTKTGQNEILGNVDFIVF
jgi:hypothetical protein